MKTPIFPLLDQLELKVDRLTDCTLLEILDRCYYQSSVIERTQQSVESNIYYRL